jgi:hypothetical protein
MRYELSKLATISAVALTLTAAPAFAQEIGDWDADADGMLSEEEFGVGFGEDGVYGGWDEDGDGALSEDEFNAGVFGGYDEDESGIIEEPEFGDVGDDIGDGGLFDI